MSHPLPPYSPESSCAKCAAEDPAVVWHSGGTAGYPCWPALDVEGRVLTEHLCKICARCGYGWCEQPADAYAQEESREDAMSIQKTAAGQVTETEGYGGMGGVIKAAQLNPTIDPAWQAEDEEQLAAENADSDS